MSDEEPAPLRVLVVEDQYVIAAELRRLVTGLGAIVIGPMATLEQAQDWLVEGRPDMALVDINLRGESAFPLADELIRRGIPFAFASGYAGAGLPYAYRSLPRLEKPVDRRALAELISRLTRGGRGG